MKIAPKLIEAYIAKPDAQHRAVLLYGPDSGLVRERTGRLRRFEDQVDVGSLA